jgi:hypothetical protein
MNPQLSNESLLAHLLSGILSGRYIRFLFLAIICVHIPIQDLKSLILYRAKTPTRPSLKRYP